MLIIQLHLPHVIINSVQALRALSHLRITFQKAQFISFDVTPAPAAAELAAPLTEYGNINSSFLHKGLEPSINCTARNWIMLPYPG